MLNPIKDIIEKIKEENSKIDNLITKISKELTDIKDYNQNLIRHLEIFVAKSYVDRKEILGEHITNI